MQSHELLREVIQKTSAKQVASDLNLSQSMIYKWAEPDEGDGSGAVNPLDRIEQLIRSTNDRRIVQWISERAGGFFILNPKTNKPHPDYLIPATNEIVQEFADLLSIIAVTAADTPPPVQDSAVTSISPLSFSRRPTADESSFSVSVAMPGPQNQTRFTTASASNV